MMAGLIPVDELRRLQKRMNRLMEDLGLSELESRYIDEMQRLQKRMSEMMEEAETIPMEGNIFMPLADVKETEDAIVVTMDLPGVEKQDVDISISDDELRVVAEKKAETEVSEKDYHKRERTYKRFERMVKLPVAVKMEEAKARLENGVLEITLPKEVVTARKRISID
ncbi:MAG TPA: Hsp20/alpha crystallin family protein [Methanotrichaceae archaeon]|nr:Hsp20/alpha crystallin family protein [Methanotrichaceae archaeon]